MKNRNTSRLSITESSDFQYLLELMLPLYSEPSFAWLPELFSTVGYEALIRLAKCAGGEIIRIPTIEELSESIESLEWYYKVWISKEAEITKVPTRYHELVSKIAQIIKISEGSMFESNEEQRED